MDNQKSNPAHILLVEDNEGDIFLILEAFEERKVKTEISVVKNGKKALDFLFQSGEYTNVKKPDLILLDINIPIYNGHEVLEKIKSDSNLKKIPVIMLTTSSNQKDVDKAYENHCNSYVKNPIEITEFLITILKIEEFCLELTILPG
jgi:CheY-like chemotaxis protein